MIDDPQALAYDLNACFENSGMKIAGGIEGAYVQYNKGEIIEKELSKFERTQLSYIQKPVEFKEESEFRYIAILYNMHEKADYIDIKIDKSFSYMKAYSG